MHELSHGSDSSKTRFKPIYLALIVLDILFVKYLPKVPISLRISMIFILFLFGFWISERQSENEREKDTQKAITPTYSLTRTDLLCMLRNAQVQKRGK